MECWQCSVCWVMSPANISYVAVCFVVSGVMSHCSFLFCEDFIYLSLVGVRERETEVEKHQCVVPCHMPPTGDLALNPRMCPEQVSDVPPSALEASSEYTEPHQLRLISFPFHYFCIFYWLCYYSCPIVFLPFIPLCPVPPFLHSSPPLVHVHGS